MVGIKEWNNVRCLCYVLSHVFICLYFCNFIYVIYLLSSPYLHVCGDDRVRGTREQMLLMQVAQVTLSCGEGLDLGNSYVFFIASGN